MKTWRWSLLLGLIAALPVGALAQQQQQQQQQPEGDRGGRRGFFGRDGLGSTTRPGGGWMAWRGLESPSDEDWASAKEFMENNLKNTWDAYNKMPDTSMRKEGAKRRIYAQYKELMQLKEKAAEDKGAKTRYDARLAQAQNGDKILGLVIELHNAPADKKPAKRAALRQAVKDRIEAELKERQAQIDTLRTRLEEQEKKLQADKDTLDQNLEKRVEFFIDHSSQFINPAPQSQRGMGFGRLPPAQEGIDASASQQP